MKLSQKKKKRNNKECARAWQRDVIFIRRDHKKPSIIFDFNAFYSAGGEKKPRIRETAIITHLFPSFPLHELGRLIGFFDVCE